MPCPVIHHSTIITIFLATCSHGFMAAPASSVPALSSSSHSSTRITSPFGPPLPCSSAIEPPKPTNEDRTTGQIFTNNSSTWSPEASNDHAESRVPGSFASTADLALSPPYWHASPASPPPVSFIPVDRPQYRHGVQIPGTDSSSLLNAAGAITLRDNEAEDVSRSDACWARSVSITDYIIIDGTSLPTVSHSSGTGHSGRGHSTGAFVRLPGAFVSWMIRVETLSGTSMTVSKRYSDFDAFRNRLIKAFPNFEAAMPELPPKHSFFGTMHKFRPSFLEKRRVGLQYFLK